MTLTFGGRYSRQNQELECYKILDVIRFVRSQTDGARRAVCFSWDVTKSFPQAVVVSLQPLGDAIELEVGGRSESNLRAALRITCQNVHHFPV